jgi:hypothetical protein
MIITDADRFVIQALRGLMAAETDCAIVELREAREHFRKLVRDAPPMPAMLDAIVTEEPSDTTFGGRRANA